MIFHHLISVCNGGTVHNTFPIHGNLNIEKHKSYQWILEYLDLSFLQHCLLPLACLLWGNLGYPVPLVKHKHILFDMGFLRFVWYLPMLYLRTSVCFYSSPTPCWVKQFHPPPLMIFDQPMPMRWFLENIFWHNEPIFGKMTKPFDDKINHYVKYSKHIWIKYSYILRISWLGPQYGSHPHPPGHASLRRISIRAPRRKRARKRADGASSSFVAHGANLLL